MRKKKPPAHENHERWLVSYADFITLLFAFFVVMFAVSQVDAQKMGRFVESVNVAFEFRGVFPESSQNPITGDGLAAGVGASAQIAPPKLKLVPDGPASRRATAMRKALEATLRGSALGDRVRIRTDRRGVVVSLTEAGFFDPGSAAVRAEAVATLRALAENLRGAGSPVAVEGHTDNVPIRTLAFPSNWELSTARATTIVRYLIDEMGYEPARLSAGGYAEYKPAGDNATSEGRSLNRRVDLVVLVDDSDGPPPGS
jgi:chemotaxis protein MotB